MKKKTPKSQKRVLARVLAQKELTEVRGGTGDVTETFNGTRKDITQLSAGDIPPV
jgi:hypothetical protein